MDEGGHRPPPVQTWIDEQEPGAFDDFVRVYEAHYDEILDELFADAAVHPAFAAQASARSPGEQARLRADSYARVKRAFRGDWASYEAHLRDQAAEYARLNVPFSEWYVLTRAVQHRLAPLLIRAYGASPDRLDGALRSMREYVDRVMSVLGTAYIAAKEAALRDSERELRDSERELRDSERDLATTLDSIGDGVIATDEEGRVIRMNPVAEVLTGWPVAEGRGRPLTEVFRVVDAATHRARELPLMGDVPGSGGVASTAHAVLIARDEVERQIADRCAPIRRDDGSIKGRVMIFRDETEERRAESALRLSEERYRSMVQGVKDYAILTLDPDGLVTTWNLGAETLKGYRPHEILGRHFSVWYPPDAVAARHPQRVLALAAEEGRYAEEGWRVRKDGTRFWASVVITALRDPQGKLLGFGKVTRDFTARKEAEDAIRRLNDELEVRARSLEASRLELRALTGRLLASREDEGRRISREVHDVVGQALTMVKMDLSWIVARLAPSSRDLIARCNDGLAMVETTLGSVRRIATECRPALLDDLGLEAALEWQAEEFQRRTGIPVVVRLPSERLVLDDERSTALFRVFQESLTNVLRHAEAHSVVALLEASAGAVQLQIRDDGKGLDPGAAFHPTALGLIGMRERATLLGGTFEIAGGPGLGTVVSVCLPLLARSAEA